MKERISDLPAIVLCALLLLLAIAAPNAGRIVIALAPTPTLGGATVLEGMFEYAPATGSHRRARYFVRTEHGLQEFHCGAFGARTDCFVRPESFNGQRAKVWHTFWHGRVQHNLNLAIGERAHPLDQVSFSYQDYWRSGAGSPPARVKTPVVVGVGLVLLFLLLRRYLKSRDAG
jgi:hypothetical protein